jgi:hypothetical protein
MPCNVYVYVRWVTVIFLRSRALVVTVYPVSALQARVLDVMAIGPNVRGHMPARCYTSFSGRLLPALARACAAMICLQCNMRINVRARVTRTRGSSRRSLWRHVVRAPFWCVVPCFGAHENFRSTCARASPARWSARLGAPAIHPRAHA